MSSPAATLGRAGLLFGHPIGLSVICLTGAWEVFALFGMRTVLVYYLARDLHYSETTALQIYAISSAASVVLSLVGAMVADRIWGLRRAVVVGALLLAAGNFFLVSESLLFAGLLLTAAGDGLLKPPLIAQIGLLYDNDDPRRDRAFTHFKVGCNLGAFLAPIVCGLVGEWWGWRWAFVAAGIGMVLCACTYVAGRHHVPADPPRVAKASPAERGAKQGFGMSRSVFATLSIAWVGAAFFWVTYNQIGGTVAFWAERGIDRTMAVGEHVFTVPSAWFQSVNPLMIFMFAPIISYLWRRETRATTALDVRRMALGTVFLAIAFMVLAADASDGRGHWFWLVLAIAPLTLGELYLEPVGQALFTRLAPRRLLSTFVAIWMLSIMMGFVASGWFASLWERFAPVAYFACIAAFTLVGASIFLLARRFDPEHDSQTASATDLNTGPPAARLQPLADD